MATVEQLQAQLAQMQAQQNQLVEGLQRANQSFESQARRLNETETRLQEQTDKLTRTETELAQRTQALAQQTTQLAQAQQAQASSTQPAGVEMTKLIHPSNVPKPQVWDGKREGWEKFKHVFVAWSSTVHPKYPEMLEKFGESKDPLDDAMQTPEEDLLAKAMYTFLVQYCPEPTMNVVGQGLHTANGFEVWRRLVRLSEPSYRTKAWVWRRHLSNPNFPKDINNWSTALHQWESELREFERTSKSVFSEEEKVSILAHVAPPELQQSIFMHSDALGTYAKIRDYIEQYLINKNVWKRPQGSQFGITKAANKVDDGGPAPMDIGAVKGKGKDDKGKGKSKHKGSWNNDKGSKGGAKGKGKEDKGKGKGHENKGTGKGKGDGKQGGKGSQVNNPDAGKKCHVCQKYGHVAKNCWWKVSSVDETTTTTGNTANKTEGNNNQTKQNPNSGNGVGSVSNINFGEHDRYCFTVRDAQVSALSESDEFRYLLVDSGACENVAKYGDFVGPVDSTKGKPLFGVQGNPLKIYGKQSPKIEVGNLKGLMDMTVTDSAESLLSVFNMVEKGHAVHFEKNNCHLVTNQNERIPLELHGKRWYLKVKHDQQSSSSSGNGNLRTQRIAPVKGVRFEEEKEPDTWRMETNEEGEFVVRVHNTARFQLFSPERMADLPVPINRLLPGRLTKIYFSEDGSHVEDQSLWTRKQTSAKNMGREWLGESWFRLKPETEIPEKKDAEIEEAKKVEGVRDPDQDMDEFFLDWVYVEDRVQPDPIDQDQAEREVFREQRQLHEEGEVKEQAQEVDVPKAPSAQQREEHRLHHANFEPWCETCIKGQGRGAPHRRSKEDKKEHIIYSDYMFFSVDGEMVNRSEGKKQKGLITVLTAICKDSQYPFAMVVPSKGGGYYSRDALAAWIRDLGWNKVTIQIDQENSMNKLFDRVRDLMPERVEIRKSPRYSSQSLADGEMVNGLIAGKIRTWLCELSESYATKIGTEHYVFPWIVRHSAWTLARFHVNKSKTTAFRVIKGRDYVGELISFGETVMGKFPKVKDKSAPRWTKGIYAGKKENSDEHMMLTSAGAISFRTVRRLPVGSQFQDAVMEVARGVPWNTVLGIEKAKPEAISSEVKAIVAPEIEGQETYDFEDKSKQENEPIFDDRLEAMAKAKVVHIPQPIVPPLRNAPRSAPSTPKGGKAQKSTKKEDKAPEMQVDDEGERIEIEEKDSKKPRLAEGTTSSAVPGDTGMNPGQPELYRIDTPTDDNMSAAGTASQDMVSGVSNGEVPDAEEMRKKYHMPVNKDHVWFQKWLDERKEYFQSEMVANIMDYLDQIGAAEEEQKKARKMEIKKLNEDFGAFTPRDGRLIPKEITVFGHKWVDKVSEGIAKSRLTCQDFKRKGQDNDRNTSEAPSNFCPTPHGCSRKLLEVYSMATGLPRVKADLTSAFLIANDQGDKTGQPVMMKPPKEWLEDYDDWYLLQPKEVQEELKDVPKEHILWQVDGNLYGRQSAAAQYRDRLEEIITKELPPEQYEFQRGAIDGCVYKCEKTGTVLIHHIDDFDICGPEKVLNDLLMIQFPKNGCKLKMGEMEYPFVGSKTTSEFLGRTKINVEEAVITKPNAKHVEVILKQLGLENAKPGPVPGKKLDLTQDKLLDEKQKAIYASCVGSAIYLSQDRPDIKFSTKELAKRIREPRECDMANLKVMGRYLRGTTNYGHVTKLTEGIDIREGIPMHCYCDSDWAGDQESRRSTSGEAIFVGGTLVESSSHTQPGTPATSSGEAEIRSLTHCAQTAVFVRNLAEKDFGMKLDTPRIWCDSSAAIQAGKKIGVGKMRHIAVGHLYIQELVKTKQVIIGKIDGTKNPADILTKHLATGELVRNGCELIGLVDLTEDGLDKHVSKTNMRTIGSVNENENKRWKPQTGSKLSVRQHASGVKRNGNLGGHTCVVGRQSHHAGKHRD